MFTISYATEADKPGYFLYDKHLPVAEFIPKVRDKRCYVLRESGEIIGVMRYNLFCDQIPFLTLIYLKESRRGNGFGTKAMLHWENEMRALGYVFVMTSTQADEGAQHFYRKLGYKDAGGIVMDIPPFQQPLELILIKSF